MSCIHRTFPKKVEFPIFFSGIGIPGNSTLFTKKSGTQLFLPLFLQFFSIEYHSFDKKSGIHLRDAGEGHAFHEKEWNSIEKSGIKSAKKSGEKSGIPLKKSGIKEWNGVAGKRVEDPGYG